MGSGNLRLLLHLRKAKANRSSIFLFGAEQKNAAFKNFFKKRQLYKNGYLYTRQDTKERRYSFAGFLKAPFSIGVYHNIIK